MSTPHNPYNPQDPHRHREDPSWSNPGYPYGQQPQEPGHYPTPPAHMPLSGRGFGYGYGAGPTQYPSNGSGSGRRLLAYLIDRFVVGVLVVVVANLLGLIPTMDPLMTGDEAAWNRWMGEMVQVTAKIAVDEALAFYFYTVFMQTTEFSTLGKRLAGLRVTQSDGSRLELGASLKRNAWFLTGLIPGTGGFACFILGFIIFAQAGAGDRTRAWNDKWAGTRVIKRS